MGGFGLARIEASREGGVAVRVLCICSGDRVWVVPSRTEDETIQRMHCSGTHGGLARILFWVYACLMHWHASNLFGLEPEGLSFLEVEVLISCCAYNLNRQGFVSALSPLL